jgi:fumarate reductase flavoprotein subunit
MNSSSPKIRTDELTKVDEHLSVAIVGGGACGLSCALHLSDLGIDSVVFERDALAQGSTALSSGFIPAVGTRLQKSLGIKDSVELFVSDIRNKSHNESDLALSTAYAQASGKALDALETLHGFEWILLDQFLYPGHSAHRMHAVAEKTGQSLMTKLLASLEKKSIPLINQALVKELWVKDRFIKGLSLVRPDGTTETYSCDALILCCNGYGGNAELVKKYLPEMTSAVFAGHQGNDGSAVIWGQQLGAQLADLGGYQGHGSWAIPHSVLITWALMLDGGVQLNALGKRFHNETKGYSEAAVEVLKQPGSVAWCVFDSTTKSMGDDFPDFRDAEKNGALKKSNSIDELAQVISCDKKILEHELNAIDVGVADETGRTFKKKLQAPFYSIKVTGALFHTQGGLGIDTQAKVLDEKGKAFANLWAAGGAARGVSGNQVFGYLSGNGLLSAFSGAYIAANSVAQYLKNA